MMLQGKSNFVQRQSSQGVCSLRQEGQPQRKIPKKGELKHRHRKLGELSDQVITSVIDTVLLLTSSCNAGCRCGVPEVLAPLSSDEHGHSASSSEASSWCMTSHLSPSP